MLELGLFVPSLSGYRLAGVVLALPLLGIALLQLYLCRKYPRLPPGPAPNWLGKSPEPSGRSWLALEQMQHQYGPIIAIRNGPFQPPTIYITRAAPVLELLEKRGATTGDRPSNYVASQVLTGVCRSCPALVER
jgi:hypothetical protein